jgi:hypothetical protein
MAKHKVIELTYSVHGLGEKGDRLDVERTEYLQNVIDNGWAVEVDTDEPAAEDTEQDETKSRSTARSRG